MRKPKLPTADHPLDQLTSTELKKYIDDLREAVDGDLGGEDREIALGRLGEAYAQYNVLVGTGAAPSIQGVARVFP